MNIDSIMREAREQQRTWLNKADVSQTQELFNKAYCSDASQMRESLLCDSRVRDSRERKQRAEDAILEEIYASIAGLVRLAERIEARADGDDRCPVRLIITFEGNPMAESFFVGQAVVATPVEQDANGNNVPLVAANLTASIDDTAVATVTPNGDGTFTVTGVAAGTANLTVEDTVYGLSDTVGVTIEASTVPGVPTTLTITFGSPITEPGSTVSSSAVKASSRQTIVQPGAAQEVKTRIIK